jgi:hypothetical protein
MPREVDRLAREQVVVHAEAAPVAVRRKRHRRLKRNALVRRELRNGRGVRQVEVEHAEEDAAAEAADALTEAPDEAEIPEAEDAADKADADKKQSPLDELDEPVSYFNAYDNELDDDELDDLVPSKPKSKPAAAAPAKKPAAPAKKPTPPSAAKPQPKQAKPVSAPVEAKKAADAKSASGDRYVVPVEINGANSDWLIPST